MLDINLLRTDPELVKENIRKKFQDEKLVMVDEVVEMDKEYRGPRFSRRTPCATKLRLRPSRLAC